MKYGMNREEALQIAAGDLVAVNSDWNRTSNRYRQLPVPCKVIEVRRTCGSQTGVLFRVKFTLGGEAELDAGWFTGRVTV